MSIGYLIVELKAADGMLPVEGASVIIKNTQGTVLYSLESDASGKTRKVPLPAPPASSSLDPYSDEKDFSIFLVEVSKPGYRTVKVYGVQVFDGITSILPVQMQPATKTDDIKEIVIPLKHGVDEHGYPISVKELFFSNYSNTRSGQVWVPNEVEIPEYITVHLGTPNSNAKNVRVPFVDYIKNVTSSEIYPTWKEEAIRANVHAQISYALNRIYTVWYMSRGHEFDITNSTAYDQFYVDGRNIFENISDIVDGIFNEYVRKIGTNGPFFTQYCNGTTVTCDGMSQWGTQSLAEQGYQEMQILKSYYPKDIEIIKSTNYTQNTATYPGTALKEGSVGEDVRLMQHYLNRIRVNYPLIPQIENPNGYYGPSTTEAVKVFQGIFNLPTDGIIGEKTWYMITRIYVGVTNLAELDSEGEQIGLGEKPPTSVLTIGSKGEDVVQLQFLLNYISQYYPSIPYVIQDSVFGETTKNAVIAFQKEFGLTPDGIVGPQTWAKLYEVYAAIQDIVVKPPTETKPPYPGTLLKIGSVGEDVKLMQEYLNGIGKEYPSIPSLVADGIFGLKTHSAVMTFQSLFNLSVDGIIGKNTWDKIVDVYFEIYHS